MTNRLFEFAKSIIPLKLRYPIVLFYYKFLNLLKFGTTDFFIAVEIEINTSCNRVCSYCPNSKYDRGKISKAKYMKTELFKKIIDELVELKFNGRISPHFYGEPLLDKRLTDLIRYTKTKLSKVYIDVYSNGDLLSVEKYQELVKAGVDVFNITEHGPLMSLNMKKVFNYRKNNNQKKPVINYRDLKSSNNLSNRGGLLEIKTNISKQKCIQPSDNVIIDYSGNVILCCDDYFSTIKWGNLNNERLFNIWKKSNYKKTRNDLKNGDFKLPLCIKCKNSKKNR